MPLAMAKLCSLARPQRQRKLVAQQAGQAREHWKQHSPAAQRKSPLTAEPAGDLARGAGRRWQASAPIPWHLRRCSQSMSATSGSGRPAAPPCCALMRLSESCALTCMCDTCSGAYQVWSHERHRSVAHLRGQQPLVLELLHQALAGAVLLHRLLQAGQPLAALLR